MIYELWNHATGNRIEGFEGFEGFRRLAEIVRQIAEMDGVEAVDDLFVEAWEAAGAPEPVELLQGDELRRLAQPLVKTYAIELDGAAPMSVRTRASQATLAVAV